MKEAKCSATEHRGPAMRSEAGEERRTRGTKRPERIYKECYLNGGNQKKIQPAAPQTDLRLDGFEEIFDGSTQTEPGENIDATSSGDHHLQLQMEKLLERLTELVSSSVDQRTELARMSVQLVDNQRQLIATQQILIRLMEKSIDLTRHISSIEEKLPAIFELSRTVDAIKERLVILEAVEID